MHLRRQWWRGLVAAVLGGLVSVTAVVAASEQFLPVLGVREGGQRFIFSPRADGYIAYLTLLNAYALTERATQDQIPLLTVGLGRTDAADGRVFPYVFTPPTTYWSQNTAKIRFIGQQAGGLDKPQGLKIAHVYIDNDYGRETLPILDHQAAQYGFAV